MLAPISPQNSTNSRRPISAQISPITKTNGRITEELVKGSQWIQTGSCFDRTIQPRDAGVRPGAHFLQKGGFRNTFLTAPMIKAQAGISPSPKLDAEDKFNAAFSIRRSTSTSTAAVKSPMSPIHQSTLPMSLRRSGNPFDQVRRPRTAPSGLTPTKVKCGAYAKRPNPPNTRVRQFYEDGHLPFALDHRCIKNRLKWITPIEKVNFQRILPVCVDGLRELEEPYRSMASLAVADMLQKDNENKALDCIPHLIAPMKTCLNTRDLTVIRRVLECVRILLTTHSEAGDLMVPHLRQLLPIFALFLRCANEHIGDEITTTLELLEKSCTTEDAFQIIKSYIPTYQSCNM